MEYAGSDEYDENTEKKGLGTPATRAGVIESLVKNGYAVRDGKKIHATDKGKRLISVVPKEVKSARLTAEWESKLQEIEHGKLSEVTFMSRIDHFISETCERYKLADASERKR